MADTLKLEIVTPESIIYSEDVEMVSPQSLFLFETTPPGLALTLGTILSTLPETESCNPLGSLAVTSVV